MIEREKRFGKSESSVITQNDEAEKRQKRAQRFGASLPNNVKDFFIYKSVNRRRKIIKKKREIQFSQ